MIFPKHNRIKYYQDFQSKIGVPSDREFEQVEVCKDGIWWKADGFGGYPYGNGQIYILHIERPSEPSSVDRLVEAANNVLDYGGAADLETYLKLQDALRSALTAVEEERGR
jgi:hypothetical protein